MKSNLIASLVLLTFFPAAHQQSALAAEPARVQVNYGIGFLPLDFYIDRREQLGIDEDQAQAMKKIIENMREPGEKLAKEMEERTKALQEAVGQNPVNAEAAMERFKAVIDVENQMKAMQFRARMEMRQLLKPEQYEKVSAMAAKAQQSKQGGASGNIQDKLKQVRQQLAQHTGGNVPREVVEQLERIEQAAKQGHGAEAEKQLNALLQQLKGGKGHGQANVEQQMRQLEEAMKNAKSPEEREQIEQHMRKLRESAEAGGKNAQAGSKGHGQANIEQQMRKLEEAMKNAKSPEEREKIEQHMRKLREAAGQHAKGAPHAGGADLEKTIRQIAEAAEHTDKPEVREQLKGAIAKLKEAAAAGKPEVVQEILRAIKPMLEGR